MSRTKGAKNKPRPLKPAKKTPQKAPSRAVETLCCICQRVLWGEVQPLPGRKARHKYNCYPGSDTWIEYMNTQPAKVWTEEQRLIFQHANRKG